jgi:FdhD protein
MMKSRRTAVRSYNRDSDQWQDHERSLIVEIPLRIMVNGEYLATLNRTPGNDLLLGLGFLYYQGLINHPEDILNHHLAVTEKELSLAPLTTDTINFDLQKPTPHPRPQSAAAIWSTIQPQADKNRNRTGPLPAQLIADLPDEMIKEQKLYTTTAGAHAVALLNKDGSILHCEEDVGRANALDKIVGYCVSKRIAMNSLGALFSGRINLEMAVKIARAGFPLVFSVSAPTATAVEILRALGISYTGSLKKRSFTLFCD